VRPQVAQLLGSVFVFVQDPEQQLGVAAVHWERILGFTGYLYTSKGLYLGKWYWAKYRVTAGSASQRVAAHVGTGARATCWEE
jgi:hypothetical protein